MSQLPAVLHKNGEKKWNNKYFGSVKTTCFNQPEITQIFQDFSVVCERGENSGERKSGLRFCCKRGLLLPRCWLRGARTHRKHLRGYEELGEGDATQGQGKTGDLLGQSWGPAAHRRGALGADSGFAHPPCNVWADPPRAPVLTSFLETPEGQRGVLQCAVDSNPRAELSLFKDQALVASTALPQPTAPPRLSVALAFNTLRVSIHPVLLEDEGEYLCSASNAYGNASATVNFTAGSECVRGRAGCRQGMEVGWSCVGSGGTDGGRGLW